MQTGSIFEMAKQIPAYDVARRYAGANVRRKGRKQWCCCPIHGEKTPSCAFYENGSFHCFGCHAGGTSIDFLMRYLSITALEAAKRICTDYGLADDVHTDIVDLAKIRQARHDRECQQRFDDTADAFYVALCDASRCLQAVIEQEEPGARAMADDPLERGRAVLETWEGYVLEHERLERLLDAFLYGELTREMKLQIMRDSRNRYILAMIENKQQR